MGEHWPVGRCRPGERGDGEVRGGERRRRGGETGRRDGAAAKEVSPVRDQRDDVEENEQQPRPKRQRETDLCDASTPIAPDLAGLTQFRRPPVPPPPLAPRRPPPASRPAFGLSCLRPSNAASACGRGTHQGTKTAQQGASHLFHHM